MKIINKINWICQLSLSPIIICQIYRGSYNTNLGAFYLTSTKGYVSIYFRQKKNSISKGKRNSTDIRKMNANKGILSSKIMPEKEQSEVYVY